MPESSVEFGELHSETADIIGERGDVNPLMFFECGGSGD
jgi:hypothetical protein